MPGYIPSSPPINDGLTKTDDGWLYRSLCQVDGFTGEVEIRTHSKHPEYGTFGIDVFDPRTLTWRMVYSLRAEEIPHIPVLEESALPVITNVAQMLWSIASAVFKQSRERGQEIDLETDLAREAAQHAVMEDRLTAASAMWTEQGVTQDDFVLSPSPEATRLAAEYEASLSEGDEDDENGEPA